jgi:hypothetical protein
MNKLAKYKILVVHLVINHHILIEYNIPPLDLEGCLYIVFKLLIIFKLRALRQSQRCTEQVMRMLMEKEITRRWALYEIGGLFHIATNCSRA